MDQYENIQTDLGFQTYDWHFEMINFYH